MRTLRINSYVTVFLAIGLSAPAGLGQTPVFEDFLTDASKITGQFGSGIFTPDGFVLTQSGGTAENGEPRSRDYVWYNLPGVGSDGSGTIEFDITGLLPNVGVGENDLASVFDGTGFNPTSCSDYYEPYYATLAIKRGKGEPANRINKMTFTAAPVGFEGSSNVLSWDGQTTYRFRLTWSGTSLRWYRGLPGQTLTLLNPPTPYNFGEPWAPGVLHIEIGATWRAGALCNRKVAGGNPGNRYSCLRVYEDDIGNVATPLCGLPTKVFIDLNNPDVADGMTHPHPADGETTPSTIAGRNCRKNLDPNQDHYFCFGVADYFAYQGSNPELYITIEYYDTITGPLTLQYDSPGDQLTDKYKNGGSVTLTGTDTWKGHEFHVMDAYFENRQNGGADFRIAGAVGNTFYLDVVGVSLESSLAPAATNPDPLDQATGVRVIAELSWAEIEEAASYDVYFGTDETAVANADHGSPEFKGNQTETTINPGIMDPLTIYYWRIDTVNVYGPTKGNLWSFTTGCFPGDPDCDYDVDQEDFGQFQACFTGPGVGCGSECKKADIDNDNDVDQDDFNMFQACMTGANIAIDPECMNN